MEAFVAWLLKLLEPLIKTISSSLYDRYQRYAQQRDIRRTAPNRIGVLLTKIDGDVNDVRWRTIADTIERELGPAAEVTRWPHPLPAPEGHQYDVTRASYGTAQRWLKDKGCDVLVAGYHKGTNAAGETVLALQFITAESGNAKDQSYKLTETLDLPVNFIADLGAALAARVVMSAAPVTHRAGHYLAPLMWTAAQRLEPMVKSLNPAFDADTRGTLLHSYALARYVIGRETGGSAHLAAAIHFFRAAAQEWARERVPLSWAAAHLNLGNALKDLGDRESGTARLEQAVEAYREAALELTRERVPLQWALVQNNLGAALQNLGEREGGTARLYQAVEAFHTALQEWTQERVPLDWAAVQNNLGDTLRVIGFREGGTEWLYQALGAFRAALREFTRERVPLYWAAVLNNLGNAVRILGERENDTAQLEQAVAILCAALEVRTRAHVPLHWAVTQSNLALAYLALAKHTGQRADAEAALAAVDGALEVFRAAGAGRNVELAESDRARIIATWSGSS